MMYRAVGDRVAVCLADLGLPLADHEVMRVLVANRFRQIIVDQEALAREWIGRAYYERGSHPNRAPDVVDCSSFTKWLYAERGIWLPRRSIQQCEEGVAVELDTLCAGDLVFLSLGRYNFYIDDPDDGVGHVGYVTEQGTIIHATWHGRTVRECSLDDFLRKPFRGAVRIVPIDREIITLQIPADQFVETSDDLKYIVLSLL